MTTDPSPIPMVRLSLTDVRDLALAALRGVGCGDDQAGPVAEATMAAEADGVHSHGLLQVVHYC
ncbi:hypothetical protein [Mongoliimonas terrestris]|uniref:hypothetical protein n=1 Tax=Mongoliimonas terrestris TaxID=1709001 RepID=UPI000A530D5D|nr:hypothetical protein [Mongoliimonas terrestris]